MDETSRASTQRKPPEEPRAVTATPRQIADVLAGLRASPKRLPTKYLYDAEGSRLFERICELPEYYPTRTETAILRSHAGDIAAMTGPDAVLLELGSGASVKTRIVIEKLERQVAYMPVDISHSALDAATTRLRLWKPDLEILPVCADFTRPFPMPKPRREPASTLVFFPGSTVGNFEPAAARALLADVRQSAGSKSSLVIGADLVKDPDVLVRAYDDAQGVTAAFDLNLLRRLNRELDSNFDLAAFRHVAVWNAERSRIEMHLVSTRAQAVRVSTEMIEFAADEHVVTEFSHKYTVAGFVELARTSGWEVVRTWTDDRNLFSVHYCRALPLADEG